MGVVILLLAATGALCALGAWVVVRTLRHPPRRSYAAALARGWPAGPDELGLAFEQREVTFDDGTIAPAWLIDGERPDGPTIVYVHGFAESRFVVLGDAALLTPMCRQLVLYDIRGHGDSTARFHSGSRREAGQLVELIDHLAMEGPVVLMGRSLGGGIAIEAGAMLGNRVAAVVTDGVYRRWHEPIHAHIRRLGWPAEPVTTLARWAMAMLGDSTQGFDRAEHAARLTCPLLLLHGAQDPVAMIESARSIARAASRGDLVEFDGGGHLDLIEIDRGHYLDAIRALIDTICNQTESHSPEASTEDTKANGS